MLFPKMKQRDVQRSVRVQRVDRTAGDAPSIGRVARVPGTGRPKGMKRRKKRGESGRGSRVRRNRRKVVITWSIVFMLLSMGTIGICVLLWVKPNRADETLTSDGSMLPPGIQKRVESKFASPSEEESRSIVSKALKIRDHAEVDHYFRAGQGGREAVIDFLIHKEDREGPVDGLDWLSSLDANNLLLEGVLVRSRKGDETGDRIALLTPDETGRWKVDFDAFARTCEPPWEQALSPETQKASVRVIVKKDIYFNGPFQSDEDWDCYAMASPDHEQTLLGYCRRDSAQARAMEQIMAHLKELGDDVTMARCFLEIRRVEGASARQFEISRVLAQDWVMGDASFDEGFQ
jgi:hypothetical protein